MGRRDEPKLDELKRLLKRLETMEPGSRPEAPRKPAPEPHSPGPGSGYVGALRSGPSGDAGEARPHGPHEAAPDDYSEYSDETAAGTRLPASSAASVVIGATTAAVVSSIIVVGLLLWANGGQPEKKSVEQRLTFVAPTSSVDPSDASTAQLAEAQSLLQRADVEIRGGNLSGARRLLEQAAKQGSGVAALTLGAMYDPARVAEFGNVGVKADPTLARAWYERAKSLGVIEATERLSELATR
jgi:hypothetical protein